MLVSTHVLILTVMSFGQIVLTVTLLAMRFSQSCVYKPLAIFLIAVGLISSGHVVAAVFPETEIYTIIAILPALLILGPTLWFYVEGLTSETRWYIEHNRHFPHIIPFLLSILICLLLLMLPTEEQNIMFLKGEVPERLYPSLVVVAGGALIIGWFGQAGYYLIRCYRRLSDYRVRLKNVFSSTEQRELNWIGVLFALLGCAWLTLVIFITVSTLYNIEIIAACFGSGLSFLLIYLLSIWGLRQKPGFESEYMKTASSFEPTNACFETSPSFPLIHLLSGWGSRQKPGLKHGYAKIDSSSVSKEEATVQTAKYSRSGLETSRANRIALKIEEAMKKDKLYLDANLSLSRLSSHIAVTPNHISQTLNEIMNSNFFNYVNRWRVEEAKRQILETNYSILEISIDVGFNSRSSFYKAFKYETGKTPNQYKHM